MFETLLVKEKNNFVKLLSKLKNTKKIISKNKKQKVRCRSSLKKVKLRFLLKIKLQLKKILKKDESIKIEKITICELVNKILDKLSAGRKPPEDITDIAKFRELNVLTFNKFKMIKINNVKEI